MDFNCFLFELSDTIIQIINYFVSYPGSHNYLTAMYSRWITKKFLLSDKRKRFEPTRWLSCGVFYPQQAKSNLQFAQMVTSRDPNISKELRRNLKISR